MSLISLLRPIIFVPSSRVQSKEDVFSSWFTGAGSETLDLVVLMMVSRVSLCLRDKLDLSAGAELAAATSPIRLFLIRFLATTIKSSERMGLLRALALSVHCNPCRG